MIDFVIESGMGAIGTPDDICAQIDGLYSQSNGGFGAFLMLAHEWANTHDTQRSYELIAKYVMPRYQGQAQATLDAAEKARIFMDDKQVSTITASKFYAALGEPAHVELRLWRVS
jgi:limonene 1,2-monooxygenase